MRKGKFKGLSQTDDFCRRRSLWHGGRCAGWHACKALRGVHGARGRMGGLRRLARGARGHPGCAAREGSAREGPRGRVPVCLWHVGCRHLGIGVGWPCCLARIGEPTIHHNPASPSLRLPSMGASSRRWPAPASPTMRPWQTSPSATAAAILSSPSTVPRPWTVHSNVAEMRAVAWTPGRGGRGCSTGGGGTHQRLPRRARLSHPARKEHRQGLQEHDLLQDDDPPRAGKARLPGLGMLACAAH